MVINSQMSLRKVPLNFITGNPKKLQELQSLFKSHTQLQEMYTLGSVSMDLDELQGEPEHIATRKALAASKVCKGPVLIEDVSLCFSALKGLPGPYIKFFLDKLGR